ncbi:VOC family protein [Chloroflexia bacterium SDU3-3]|nr:VOC family protein [Chloroflexia bacterium SDU3-3]
MAPPHAGRADFRSPSVNYYVADVEAAARFYTQRFGFVERFRTPSEGEPVHVELRLGDLVLGLAARSAGEAMHGLPLGQGSPPRAEVVVWTDDVDAAYAALLAEGVPGVSAPHDFLGALRAAWVLDPDGNPVEIVARI